MPKITLVLTCTCVASILCLSAMAAGDEKRPQQCSSSREYITAMEYLRSRKDLPPVFDKDAARIANKVAAGCSGAAKRFIRVSELLSRAGLTMHDTVSTAVELSGRSDTEVETFLVVFKRAFLSESLDLDLLSSLKMAHSLSVEFKGDVSAVRDDFERVLNYCLDEGKLNLPRPQCGDLAAKVARLGENAGGGVSKPFIKTLEFVRSSKGPEFPIRQAIELASTVVSFGKDASDNFMQAYQYAASKSGMSYGKEKATAFARDLASKTTPASPVPSAEPSR